MSFDFSKATQSAHDAASSSGGNNEFKYKLVYPDEGSMTLKLLFNPASGLLMRKISRHTIGDEKVPCLEMYGMKCPLDEVIKEIRATKGDNALSWQYDSVFRSLGYAQYIDSSYHAKMENNGIGKGDVILLMSPWTVFKGISNIVNTAAENPENLRQLMASNEGIVIRVQCTRGTRVEYQVAVDPFQKYTSCPSEAEFEKLLTELPSLNSAMYPETVSPEIIKKVGDLAIYMNQKYLGSSIAPVSAAAMQMSPPANLGQAMGLQNTSAANTFVPPQQPPQGNPASTGNPTCMGMFGQVDSSKCLLCPSEFNCRSMVK